MQYWAVAYPVGGNPIFRKYCDSQTGPWARPVIASYDFRRIGYGADTKCGIWTIGTWLDRDLFLEMTNSNSELPVVVYNMSGIDISLAPIPYRWGFNVIVLVDRKDEQDNNNYWDPYIFLDKPDHRFQSSERVRSVATSRILSPGLTIDTSNKALHRY